MQIFQQQIYDPLKLYGSRIVSRIIGDLNPRPNSNAPIPRSAIRRILVIDRCCIGDVIMIEPALSALREYYSDARVELLCVPAFKALAEKADMADRVYAYPAETPYHEQFDMLINFHPDLRQIRLMKQVKSTYRAGFSFSGGARTLTHIIPYPYREHQVERPFALLEEMYIPVERQVPRLRVFENAKKDPKRILLHPGAKDSERRWPAKYWRRLITLLEESGYKPQMIAAPDIRKLKNIKYIEGDLLAVAAKIAGAALLIGCDSMAVHLAAALETPALAIFGSQDPDLTKPYGPYGHYIAPLQPCRHRRRNWRLCAKCMAEIRPSALMDKVREILENGSRLSGKERASETEQR
ncbi:MAG: glycosyltransferase family 9 protein [Candidatus Marinimicrobia bacterium]|jgi:ADP-heptose:LPS heptosyltransferase|nr:glycosyltransferase family 9 protein [Candidatus Neomarinimicrobiota bacterium]MDD4961359.1 glycosyltransferase family 9 protein [Candidatus Neomarinimicrobiota bacterium]MDD5709218.1 glycosyltransferase family 9 protein [Candidatus Neomarinimicrobiota bacterium]